MLRRIALPFITCNILYTESARFVIAHGVAFSLQAGHNASHLVSNISASPKAGHNMSHPVSNISGHAPIGNRIDHSQHQEFDKNASVGYIRPRNRNLLQLMNMSESHPVSNISASPKVGHSISHPVSNISGHAPIVSRIDKTPRQELDKNASAHASVGYIRSRNHILLHLINMSGGRLSIAYVAGGVPWLRWHQWLLLLGCLAMVIFLIFAILHVAEDTEADAGQESPVPSDQPSPAKYRREPRGRAKTAPLKYFFPAWIGDEESDAGPLMQHAKSSP